MRIETSADGINLDVNAKRKAEKIVLLCSPDQLKDCNSLSLYKLRPLRCRKTNHMQRVQVAMRSYRQFHCRHSEVCNGKRQKLKIMAAAYNRDGTNNHHGHIVSNKIIDALAVY